MPEGVREARFLNASFPHIAPETVRWFACQHLTRELVFRPEWQSHANGAERLVEAIVVHPSPVELRATYTKLFGEAVQYDRDRLVIKLGEDEVGFVSPGAFQARFSVPSPVDLSKGWFAGAVFRVGSLEQVEAVLSRAGVNFSRTPSGSIAVPPSEAAGALLEFVALP